MSSAEDVEAVLRATSLYEVLGVDAAVGDAALRKAYLKKSLAIHPDKCQHPRATEAFQHIAHAYDTLSDPAKRRLYDLSTNHGAKPEASGATYGDEDGEPLSAAQAFNMFDSAMKQFAREQGIEEVTRRETVLDTVASGFLYLDSLLGGGSSGGTSSSGSGGSGGGSSGSGSGGGSSRSDGGSSRSGGGGGAGSARSSEASAAEGGPASRLQSWAQTFTAAGTVLSTFQQIYSAQRERERAEEDAARAAQAAGAAAQGTQTRSTEEAWSRAQAQSRQTREGGLPRGRPSSSSSSGWSSSMGPASIS
jgi:curved DNA-binding protein CbpA